MEGSTTRQMFRYINRFMVVMWRLGMGPLINIWPQVIGRIMVITHTGRKTGLRRRTPVNYAIINGELFCAAGFGISSDWYRNISSSPEVEVWLPQGWWSGDAFPADDRADRLEILRQIMINSGFAAPVFAGVHPRKISDLQLEQAMKDDRLVCIRRKTPCTGTGGPSDLAWIWPAMAHVALFIWLTRVLCKRCNKNRSK